MSTVSTTQSTAASVLANINTREKKADATASEDMNARFLTLLTTQLKNQDPLNPMENAEVTSQLAQMSTVDGAHLRQLRGDLGVFHRVERVLVLELRGEQRQEARVHVLGGGRVRLLLAGVDVGKHARGGALGGRYGAHSFLLLAALFTWRPAWKTYWPICKVR